MTWARPGTVPHPEAVRDDDELVGADTAQLVRVPSLLRGDSRRRLHASTARPRQRLGVVLPRGCLLRLADRGRQLRDHLNAGYR